jgi:hypothetical protein
MEDTMRAKRLITRTILAAVAAGTIAGGVALPIVTAVAPATGTAAVSMTPNYMPLNG